MQLPNTLKRITRPLVGRIPITITAGPNRGMRWSLASSGNGYREGRREPERMAQLGALIRPEDVVWDVGAHYGYVTLMAARKAGDVGRLHAFEPARQSRWYLSRHVAWNHLGNVTIHPYAISDFDGEADFGGDDSSQLFALGGGDERVQVRSGTSLVRSRTCPPATFMKVDVEGAEVEVIRGVLEVLRPDARLFVAMHSQEMHEACCALLTSAGFTAAPSSMITNADPDDWPGDPDVFFYGPECVGGEADLRRLTELGF